MAMLIMTIAIAKMAKIAIAWKGGSHKFIRTSFYKSFGHWVSETAPKLFKLKKMEIKNNNLKNSSFRPPGCLYYGGELQNCKKTNILHNCNFNTVKFIWETCVHSQKLVKKKTESAQKITKRHYINSQQSPYLPKKSSVLQQIHICCPR